MEVQTLLEQFRAAAAVVPTLMAQTVPMALAVAL
jgi:hypothetical protein